MKSNDCGHSMEEVADREKIRALPWGLLQGMLNSVFAVWTFGGTVFLLFLGELGLPKDRIGIALALFPFCQLVALGFAPVAARWGRKRTFLAGYGGRKVVMAGLLVLPWLMAHTSRTAGEAYLFVVIGVFAMLRALAETAYYPWTQEFTPNRLRGQFAGWSTVTGLLASIVAAAVAGLVIGHGAGLHRYLGLIGAGCVLGLLGMAAMTRVPGGKPLRDATDSISHTRNMLAALRDRNFLRYLGGFGAATLGTGLFLSFLPMFVKEKLGVTSGMVVTLDIAVMAGGALASLVLGWVADRVGSRPVLMPSMLVSLLIPVVWLIVPRQTGHAVGWCAVLYFLQGVANVGALIAAGRLLFNRVIPRKTSTAYTAIYYAWMGITAGLAPLVAGRLLAATAGWQTRLGALPVDGYALLFLLALMFLAFGWWCYGRVKPDDVHTTRTVLARMVNGMWGWRPW